MNNVSPIVKQPIDPVLTTRRMLASASALNETIKALRAELARETAVWTKRLTEATQEMNEPLRCELATKVSAKETERLLRAARDGRKKSDELKEEAREDKAARKRKIAEMDDALSEALAIAGDGGLQMSLVEGVAGMGWATDATRSAVYGSLMYLDTAGVKLTDEHQELLVALGTTGLKPMELGLDPAKAIEAEESDDNEECESDDDDGDPAEAPASEPLPF